MKKKGVFVVVFALLVSMGSASVAQAAESAAPLVRFDASLVDVIDCADARAVAADFSSRQTEISVEDAHAAARAFIACERTRRSDVEKTNLMRVLAASSLLVAANAERDEAQQTDLSAAQAELQQVQPAISLTSGNVRAAFIGRLSTPAVRGDDRFERVETLPPTTSPPQNRPLGASVYEPLVKGLLLAIEMLRK